MARWFRDILHRAAFSPARAAAFEGDQATVDRLIAVLSAHPDEALARVGAMADARIASWQRDLRRTLEAVDRMKGYRGNVTSSLMELVSRFEDATSCRSSGAATCRRR